MHVEQFQLRGVELAARPGASFENPQQRCVGAMAGRQQQQVAGLQGAQLAGVQRQAGPLQRQAQRYGQALRRGRGGRRASSVAGSPSSQSARRWSSRSRLRRRPIAARGCAGLRPYQTRPGKTLPSRSSKASCRPPAGWRRLPPAGSARASGPAPGPGRESAGAGRPTPGSVRDRRRGGLGDVQARLQSVADIVATATCETSLEIQFGAAGERQVEVRPVHSACHSSCR